jgi:hypothetical protein
MWLGSLVLLYIAIQRRAEGAFEIRFLRVATPLLAKDLQRNAQPMFVPDRRFERPDQV